ncbi:hypothetical protein K458DRAFT_381244 [Lentithecium fluviatile CBS 122367]|uniref:Uncharacterized protein n=1 Tax=Lentithecium fluviatile CBS 122367 TaxID=1168545 RepID=A0A6G1JLM2_9PLEO|nr:hypothetical protein K458DRAFT_381244 [Lentithecium fluviatile CBS 122367]
MDTPDKPQYETPTKARVRGAIEYMEARGIPHHKEDVFRLNGVSHRRGPYKIEPRHIREMDRLLQEGFEARALTWEQLGWEVGLEGVSGRTIQRTLGTMDYHKCIACRKG